MGTGGRLAAIRCIAAAGACVHLTPNGDRVMLPVIYKTDFPAWGQQSHCCLVWPVYRRGPCFNIVGIDESGCLTGWTPRLACLAQAGRHAEDVRCARHLG
jgi:hypothetical protein